MAIHDTTIVISYSSLNAKRVGSKTTGSCIAQVSLKLQRYYDLIDFLLTSKTTLILEEEQWAVSSSYAKPYGTFGDQKPKNNLRTLDIYLIDEETMIAHHTIALSSHKERILCEL